jgi:putative ABC transport system substrate-binding protein
LHTFGYSEGQNIAVEFRYTEGRSDRAEEFAEELVRLNVDVIVAHFVPAVDAAMEATRTIPIVMAPHGAPLQLGAIDGQFCMRRRNFIAFLRSAAAWPLAGCWAIP